MPNIAAAEAQLRADDRPVLFLDTCILLDIIRATYRCLGSGYVQRADELRTMLMFDPPQCCAGCRLDGANGMVRQRPDRQG